MVKSLTHSQLICFARLTSLATMMSLAAASTTIPAIAQESTTSAAPSEPVCMVRQRPSEERVAIVLPQGHAEPMAQAGYVTVPCNAAFASAGSRTAWRDRVCEMASIDDEGMQSQLERVLGQRAAVLCAMAEVSEGRWQRPRGRQ